MGPLFTKCWPHGHNILSTSIVLLLEKHPIRALYPINKYITVFWLDDFGVWIWNLYSKGFVLESFMTVRLVCCNMTYHFSTNYFAQWAVAITRIVAFSKYFLYVFFPFFLISFFVIQCISNKSVVKC